MITMGSTPMHLSNMYAVLGIGRDAFYDYDLLARGVSIIAACSRRNTYFTVVRRNLGDDTTAYDVLKRTVRTENMRT